MATSTSGNSNTQALNVSGSYTLRRDSHRLQFDARFNRGEANGELAAQNAAGTLKYDYLLTRQVYVSGKLAHYQPPLTIDSGRILGGRKVT